MQIHACCSRCGHDLIAEWDEADAVDETHITLFVRPCKSEHCGPKIEAGGAEARVAELEAKLAVVEHKIALVKKIMKWYRELGDKP